MNNIEKWLEWAIELQSLAQAGLTYGKDIYETVIDADALLLVTEWKEFRMPSWSVIKKLMSTPLILDGRNIYDKTELEETGFIYHCIGR